MTELVETENKLHPKKRSGKKTLIIFLLCALFVGLSTWFVVDWTVYKKVDHLKISTLDGGADYGGDLRINKRWGEFVVKIKSTKDGKDIVTIHKYRLKNIVRIEYEK